MNVPAMGVSTPAFDAARLSAFGAAARHSERVRKLKIALPALAIGIVVAFVGYSFISMPGNTLTAVGENAFSDGKLVMANPRLEGYTNSRPYSMSAERAVQEPDSAEIIKLERIDAKLPIDLDNWATIDAAGGVFDRKNNTLVIDNPLKVTTTDGKTAALESAYVDVGGGSLTTDKPVNLSMDGVRLSADSMQVLEGGQVMVFDRQVRMHIEPGKMKSVKAEAGAADVNN